MPEAEHKQHTGKPKLHFRNRTKAMWNMINHTISIIFDTFKISSLSFCFKITQPIFDKLVKSTNCQSCLKYQNWLQEQKWAKFKNLNHSKIIHKS